MSHRRISGLKWVREAKSPFGKTRLRGAKARGKAFEKAFAKALPSALYGPWFEYEDAKGPGLCQPDFILREARCLFVLETKYTWTWMGHLQIEQLYRPILELFWGLPVFGIVVCKNLLPAIQSFGVEVVHDLGEAKALALAGRRPVLQWLGPGTPLRHSSHGAVASAESIGL